MSSQGSNDDHQVESDDVECLWCGVSQRLFPNNEITWAVIDAENKVGICVDCWDVLPEHDRQLQTTNSDGDSTLKKESINDK